MLYLSIFLILFKVVHPLCPTTDSINITCFTQSDFDAAFQAAAVANNATENILLSSAHIDGFRLDESAAIFHHFSNGKLDPFVIQQNRNTTVLIAAIQWLKNSKNLTKSQLRKCLQNISTSNVCTPIKINCNVTTTT